MNKQLNDALFALAKKLGKNPQEMQEAISANPELIKMLDRLTPQDINKVSDVLADDGKTNKIIASKQGQELINKYFKKK
ncbi:MAG: hypothetical protein LBL82_06265 [Oscillospiraceae bacterium]|jgi:nicotinate-nucleotide pyrophosphorylase|nr:hypothetical protein [Oscillospiraceae bacterium]